MNDLKKNSFSFVAVLTFLAVSTPGFAGNSGYHLLKKIPLGGGTNWDYLNFDSVSRHLYVTHGTEVDVLSPDGKVLGNIPNTPGVHGVITVADAGVGYTTNGAANTSTLFELKSLNVLAQIPTGDKPDAIGYDPSTGCVYICNGKSETASVIEAASGGTVSTIPLGGDPEYLAVDGKGHVFINLKDKSEVVEIDTNIRKIAQTWSLPAGSSPSSMAIDKTYGKLFIGCRNKTMIVFDIQSGQVVQTLPIGDHVDATVFDSSTGDIFNSCGEGVITLIHQDSPNTYSVTDTIQTLPGARTLALDPKTHQLYLPAMDGTVFTLLIMGQ